MNSRVHPKYKTKYRVQNWAAYDRGLVRRGSITLWLTPEAVAAWKPQRSGKPGGQPRYSDLAIETALTLRLVFHMPLRQTEGFLSSIFEMMGVDLEVPDHTTLSRRGQCLEVALSRIATNNAPIHLVIDSTGLSIVGEGEWAAAKHGGKGRRGWKKLHLGVDGSGAIIAQVLTDGNVGRREDRTRLDRGCGGRHRKRYGRRCLRHDRDLRSRPRSRCESHNSTDQDGDRIAAGETIECSRPHDQAREEDRETAVEEGVRLPSPRHRRERLLPL